LLRVPSAATAPPFPQRKRAGCDVITNLLTSEGRLHIEYFSDAVQAEILDLPDTLDARYIVLTRRMLIFGPHLGEPHTKAFGGGLFELRLKGAEGIARVFFCTLVGRRIVMLPGFVKKPGKTPTRERRIAETRLKELKS